MPSAKPSSERDEVYLARAVKDGQHFEVRLDMSGEESVCLVLSTPDLIRGWTQNRQQLPSTNALIMQEMTAAAERLGYHFLEPFHLHSSRPRNNTSTRRSEGQLI